jgi:hypothetical protein
MTHSNLTPRRGPNVWDQRQLSLHGKAFAERAVVGSAGAALLIVGLQGRSVGRWTTAAAGAWLLALAGTPGALDRLRAWGDRAARRWQARDVVNDQSEDSFPASDAPAWTTATAGGPEAGAGR